MQPVHRFYLDMLIIT